jgi:hypothetical protein
MQCVQRAAANAVTRISALRTRKEKRNHPFIDALFFSKFILLFPLVGRFPPDQDLSLDGNYVFTKPGSVF